MQELRGNKLGLHFRRQQIIAGFIADFYCYAASLIIEVDGGIHSQQTDYDAERDQVFTEMGLRVIHVRNEDVLKNLPKVLNEIRGAITPGEQ